jgi:hypothetical protein
MQISDFRFLSRQVFKVTTDGIGFLYEHSRIPASRAGDLNLVPLGTT